MYRIMMKGTTTCNSTLSLIGTLVKVVHTVAMLCLQTTEEYATGTENMATGTESPVSTRVLQGSARYMNSRPVHEG